MQSNLIKLLLFAAFLVCLYFALFPSVPDNANPELTPKKVPQQVTEKKSFSKRDTVSTALADYIDACIAVGNDPLPDTSEDYTMNDLKEVDRFFDVISESMMQGEQKLQKLVSYYRKHPDDELVALEIIRVCTATPSLEQCDSTLLGSLTLSSSDAQPWIYLASFHAARNDREKVIQAMKSAIQSDFYGNGYAERVSRLSDIINHNTSWGLYSTVVAAIGIEASNSVFPQDVFTFCKEASSDLYTATLCYQLGQDMALRGQTLALSGAGQSLTTMMRNVSKFGFPNDSVSGSPLSDVVSMRTIWPLMNNNDRLLLNWLNDMKALGEKQAAERAIQTVRTLAISGDYTHCAD